MERITEIKQLKPGDKIWTINTFTGNVDIIEFVCEHPHNSEYSIFMDEKYDGMPKFYNKHLADAVKCVATGKFKTMKPIKVY